MSQDYRLCKVRSISVRVSGLDGKGWKKGPNSCERVHPGNREGLNLEPGKEGAAYPSQR
jgi:hypothetical protein